LTVKFLNFTVKHRLLPGDGLFALEKKGPVDVEKIGLPRKSVNLAPEIYLSRPTISSSTGKN
jgi:hypothetical protein